MKVRAIISHLPNVDTKMEIKKKVTKELHNLEELKITTTRVTQGRYLKVFATLAERRATCPKIVGQGKSPCLKRNGG